jgi:hypothetical protein
MSISNFTTCNKDSEHYLPVSEACLQYQKGLRINGVILRASVKCEGVGTGYTGVTCTTLFGVYAVSYRHLNFYDASILMVST